MNILKTNPRVIGLLVLLLLSTTESHIRADSHDGVVYQKYSHNVTPGKIPYEFDMKFVELVRPGTQQDVEAGKAVFTFEGLGESRVWKLPKCPIWCEWPSLNKYPFEGQSDSKKTNFNNFGYICQAEELQINGKWKRYFGFVSKHGTAVVPAEKIYLSFNDCDPTPHIVWTHLPGGMGWGMLGPDAKMESGIVVSKSLEVGDPLPVELYIRNHRGVSQKILGDIYRRGPEGKPAFHKGIKLSLAWAPFDPKNPDSNYPHEKDFKPIAAIHTNFFVADSAGPELATGQTAQKTVFDIRDWFNVNLAGYYKYDFEFNPAELGLPTNEIFGPHTYMSFIVGSEPKRPTVEELNRDIPFFGGVNEEKRLRTLIKQSMGDSRPEPIPTAEQLPELNHTSIPSDSGPPDEPEIVGLWNANRELLEKLTMEGNDQSREKLDVLMEKESALPMKLLLASSAASAGSKHAALFLLDCLTNADYVVAQNTYAAVRLAINHSGTNVPVWLVEMAIAALSDERYVTGLQNSGWSSDTFFKMAYMADEHGQLTSALGNSKCTSAVPFLIEMAKKTNGRRGPVMALGNLGDPRAIPALIEFVKQKGSSAKQQKEWYLEDDFLRPVSALGNLRAKEAVPILLEYIEHRNVIEALENIGDSRVIAPLQKLIVAKGKMDKVGVNNDPEFEKQRLVAARIAVASLDADNRTTKLCELLTDPSFDQYQRRSVIWRLGKYPDSRAIPFLGKAIKTDPSGAVVNQAISVLAVFKYKAAVDVLLDCFDADFHGKSDWKRAYKPEMFRDNIAESLRELTGQAISTDKEQWLTWWKLHRDATQQLE